jgi:hypothetical protein
MIFSAGAPIDFIAPDYEITPFLNRPQISPSPALEFLTPDDLGAPLYPVRSRMSDANRAIVAPEIRVRCTELVRREGGRDFFKRPGWKRRLRAAAETAVAAEYESADEQRRSIEQELANSRAILNDRLKTRTVNHICLPWGVAGRVTETLLARVGYRSAFANRMRGTHAVRQGDDPFWLKRLPNRYIPLLPGRGRRYWFSPPTRITAAT